MMQEKTNAVLVGGSGSQKLCKKLSLLTGIPQAKTMRSFFPSGELRVSAKGIKKGSAVILVQSFFPKPQDAVIEFLLLLDAVKRQKPKNVFALIPFFAYARQDRKTEKGQVLPLAMLATLFRSKDITKIVTLDMHSRKGKRFFGQQLSSIAGTTLFAEQLPEASLDCVIAPDKGAEKKGKRIAKLLKIPYSGAFNKERKKSQITKSTFKKKVKGKVCLLVDDMIDTGGTILKAAAVLKKKGAQKIVVYATHGVLSGNAQYLLEKNTLLDAVYLSDSIEQKIPGKKFTILSAAPLLSKKIKKLTALRI